MKKKKLKKLIVTTLSLTVLTTLLTSTRVVGAWRQQSDGWHYLNEKQNDTTGWVNDQGTWYYMNSAGIMQKGWIKDNSSWYYLTESGAMKIGWVKDNGIWYYLTSSGAMRTGWINDGGTWYYADNSGAMKTGWINDKGTWYYTDNSGAMQTGIIQENGKIYYLDASGGMKTGNIMIEGKVCNFGPSGELISGQVIPYKVFDSNGIQIEDSKPSNEVTDANNENDILNESNGSSGGNSNHNHNSGSNGNNGDNENSGDNENTDKKTNYLENYRDQYHFSVSNAWGNDPNGMVYYNGEYHLFYQYYPDDVVWGPMHWGHAVSKDLIHWEELGVVLEPGEDEVMGEGQRYIFSGCAVVDENDSTGLFNGGSGLVAIYTTHVEGKKLTDEQCDALGLEHGSIRNTEEQSIAYSKDNGRTWIKYNNGDPVLTIEEDPLKRPSEFRDPKVFYNEEAKKWFMVTAGGPLRFFSSENLIDWKAEAMQDNINTECPDFFKLKDEESGEERWVLNGAGRFYMIGDFKLDDEGKYRFYPETKQIVMNFGKDSYAAQTYYGTAENGTPDGRRIMINWMNNWDYCNSIGKITQTFNGTYTLQNELKLVKNDDGEFRLKQQPINEYKQLRKEPTTFKDITIEPGTNVMSNLSGTQYEIVANFKPDSDTTEVGFKLRVGDNGQETIVKYNVQDEELVVDRSKSGKNPKNTDAFVNSYSNEVTKNADGTINLRIFVDSASVEVYANDGDAVCSSLIFPDRDSSGIEAYSVGGNTKADITYYPLSGIWNNESASILSLSESELNKEIGDEFTIKTSRLPKTSTQGVDWEISDSKVVTIVSQNDKETKFKVIGDGNATLTATSKDKKLTAKTVVNVYNYGVPNDFEGLTNIESFGGQWYTEGNKYIADGKGIGDGFATADQINYDLTATYTYEVDAKLLDGGDVAGLTLFSQKKDAAQGSIVANIIKNGEFRVFKFPSGENLANGFVKVSPTNEYHLKVEVKGQHIKYWINDELVCDAEQDWYKTGYFGFNICNAKVEFTNAKFTSEGSDQSTLGINQTKYELDLNDEFTVYANQNVRYTIGDQDIIQTVDAKDSKKTIFRVVGAGKTTINVKPVSGNAESVVIEVNAYDVNPDNTPGLIEGLNKFQTIGNARWFVKDDAFVVNANGDAFAISNKKITQNTDSKYTFETEATVLNKDNDCAPSLVLFSKNQDKPTEGSLVFNINANNGDWRIFEFGGGIERNGNIEKAEDGVYKLKVVVNGEKITYYINDVAVAEDVTGNAHTKGYVGLMSWNANVEFRNTIFKENIDVNVDNYSEDIETYEEVESDLITGNDNLESDDINNLESDNAKCDTADNDNLNLIESN